MYARITTITGSQEGSKEARRVIAEQAVPGVKNISGMKKAYFLADDANGKFVGLFLFDNEGDLIGSREAATKLRESVVKNWGGTIQSVDEYEVFAEV